MAYTIDLSGHRALVTGGGQGVGRGVALALASAGARVAVNDLKAERADQVVEEIRQAGGQADSAAFNVTDHEAVMAAAADLPGVDILVNNAGNAGGDGWLGMVPFAESTPDQWDPFLKVNLFGVIYCTHAFLPSMIAAKWGRVVTIISDAARFGEPNQAVYAAAKAGAAGLSRSVAREVGRHGVNVNCIALASMNTPLTARAAPDPEADKKSLRNYVIRRRGEPEDVAGMVTFLASDRASWITGQTYPVNGGYTLAL